MNLFAPHYIDFYKAGHVHQYPKGTELIFSNYTARSSRIKEIDYIVWFGLQYFIKEYLIKQWNETFFKRSQEEAVELYRKRISRGLGTEFNVDHIRKLHGLGYLPLRILSLPEGSAVPLRVPPMVMCNTEPEFFWITNYIETILSMIVWGASNSATIASRYRILLDDWAEETGGSPDFVGWQGHDFSARGMFGLEAACLSSAAHLLFFNGTDSVFGLDFIDKYYKTDNIIAGSVPATEHSVMCTYGQANEIELFRHLITNVYPTGIVSIVSDTWDLWKVITNYLPQLKEVIENRQGKVVIRPDSGDPVDIICGKDVPSSSHSTTEFEAIKKGVVQCLWDIFGGKENEKGYKELAPCIGAIYGDSITPERANQICEKLAKKGFASTNIVFGIGSYTYQYNTRDTLGQAIKATYAVVDGEGREIFKAPKTDNGIKNSAKGLLAVHRTNTGSYVLQEQATWEQIKDSSLELVFYNGTLIKESTFTDVQEQAKASISRLTR